MRLEFLYERTGVEEPTYLFKHALTQEVAYESLLTTRRQGLHAAEQALEAWYSERLEEVQDRLACSLDAFETAIDRGWLDYAYLEKGEHATALPVLEQAVQEAIQYRSLQVQSWFKAFLGEAYRVNQQLDKARDLAQQGLELAKGIAHGWGAALARTHLDLATLAHAQDNAEAAATYLSTAWAWFVRLQVPRYVERADHLAQAYGLTLIEVPPAELS